MESTVRITPKHIAALFHCPAPDQVMALEKIDAADNTWVSCSDRRKSMELLTAMCWYAALQGETTLVCVSPDGRQQVVDALRDMGMQGLFFDLCGQADSAVLGAFQVARKKRASAATEHQAEVALQEFHRWITEQEQGYHNLERVLFGDLSWKDIVDQRSTVPPSAYQHFLTASVKDRFDLTHKEYWHLRGRIKSFARLRTLRTSGFETLEALNPKLFEDPDASLRETVVTALQEIVDNGREVLCMVADAVHAYKQDLTSDHQSRTTEIVARISQIQQLIAAGETKFGQRFFDESTLSNTWHALIRSARPEIRKLHYARDNVREAFIDLYTVMQDSSHAQLDDITAFMPDPLTIDAIKCSCEEITDVIQEWTRRVDAHASEQRRRVNAQNISRNEGLREMLQQADNRIEAFVELISRTDILKTVPEINALSIEKKATVIEATVRLCLRLLDAADDIDAFTLWTGFWSAQNTRTKAVLLCLDLMEDHDLVQAFDTWYFGLTLGQIPDRMVVHGKTAMPSEHPQLGDLRAAVEGHLRAITQTSRHEVMREIATVSKAFVQSIAKSQLNIFGDELRILPAKDLMRLFPVVLCNQEQVTEYAYYADALYVVTDEGHDYKTFAAQSKRCVMLTTHPPKFAPDGWSVLRMDELSLDEAEDWRTVATSDRLAFVDALASQFTPFLDEMRVYNARGIQVFSFLGDRLDNALLQRLGMPYKLVGEHGLTHQLVMESFLDRRKPIMILLRDQKLGHTFRGYLPWHHRTVGLLRKCGIRVQNLWSVDLKNSPAGTMEKLYEEIRRFAEEVNASTATVQESPNLSADAQAGPQAVEPIPQKPQYSGYEAGI
jgi:hypothetical protein